MAPVGKTGGVAKYVGNSNSKKFHRPDCQWAQKIASQNRVEFRSREEAVKAGYVPCTCVIGLPDMLLISI